MDFVGDILSNSHFKFARILFLYSRLSSVVVLAEDWSNFNGYSSLDGNISSLSPTPGDHELPMLDEFRWFAMSGPPLRSMRVLADPPL